MASRVDKAHSWLDQALALLALRAPGGAGAENNPGPGLYRIPAEDGYEGAVMRARAGLTRIMEQSGIAGAGAGAGAGDVAAGDDGTRHRHRHREVRFRRRKKGSGSGSKEL